MQTRPWVQERASVHNEWECECECWARVQRNFKGDTVADLGPHFSRSRRAFTVSVYDSKFSAMPRPEIVLIMVSWEK